MAIADDDIGAVKRECLERWRARQPARRQLAILIMNGERDIEKKWPDWVKRDIDAELSMLREERAESERQADLLREKRARQDEDKAYLL